MIISNLIYHFFNTYLHFAKLKKCDKKAKKSPIYFFSKEKNVFSHSSFYILHIPNPFLQLHHKVYALQSSHHLDDDERINQGDEDAGNAVPYTLRQVPVAGIAKWIPQVR